MKKTIIMALALIACNAFAGTDADYQDEENQRNFYVQAEGGYTRHDFEDHFLMAESVSNDSGSFAFRIGSLTPLQNGFSLGLEVGVLFLGDTTYDNYLPGADYKGSQSGFDILIMAKKYLNERVNLFGKAGIAYIEQENKFSAPTLNREGEFTGDNVLPEAALGLGVNLTPQLELTATASHIFGEKFGENTYIRDVASSTSAMLGLRYTF